MKPTSHHLAKADGILNMILLGYSDHAIAARGLFAVRSEAGSPPRGRHALETHPPNNRARLRHRDQRVLLTPGRFLIRGMLRFVRALAP